MYFLYLSFAFILYCSIDNLKWSLKKNDSKGLKNIPPHGFIMAQETEWHALKRQIWDGIPAPPFNSWVM